MGSKCTLTHPSQRLAEGREDADGDGERCEWKRRPHSDGGTDWSGGATSQGTPGSAGKHWELEEARGALPPRAWGELCLAETLISGFRPPDLWENRYLFFEATKYAGCKT